MMENFLTWLATELAREEVEVRFKFNTRMDALVVAIEYGKFRKTMAYPARDINSVIRFEEIFRVETSASIREIKEKAVE